MIGVRRRAVALALLTAWATGCSSSVPRAAGTTTTSASAAVSVAKGTVDCDAAKTALGGSIVNWQMVAQLATEPDVAKWAARTKVLGSLGSFGSQLDTLQAQLGSGDGVVPAISFMRGAHTIVQRGLAGDTGASAALSSYLGSDLTATLNKPTPIGQAVAAAGC